MKIPLHAAAAFLAASLPLACGRTATPDAFTVRDSAGIRIAENHDPEWADGTGWRITDTPLASIGGGDDRPGHDLYDVSGAVILSDGAVAIANGGTNEVRIFDAAGALLRSFGGSGEGPAEFRSMGRLFLLPGDSLLLTDPRLNRISVFTRDGALLRTAQVAAAPDGGVPSAAVRLGDGTLIARPGFTFGTGTAAGIHRDTLPLYRYGTDGRFEASLGRFPMSEHFVYNEGDNSLAGERIWGLVTRLAAVPEGFVAGYSADWSYETRGPGGELRRIVRARRPLRPVRATDIAQLEASAADGDPSADAFWRRLLAATEFPTHFPAYAQLVTDAGGHVWLEDYPWPETGAPRAWQVFTRNGRWLGTVTLPAGLRPLHIENDVILGVARDALDVEQVRVYRLDRSAG